MVHRFRDEDVADIYYRLDVDRGLNEIAMEEWKKLALVRQHTKNYLKLTVVDRRIDKLVDTLVGRHTYKGCEIGSLGST
jgi:hypothetical protein